MKTYDFTGKIEDMSMDQLKQRISDAYNEEMPKIVPVPYLGEKIRVTYEYRELVSRCPMTGYNDLNELIIEYIPNQLIPELKSFKFYLMAYKDLPISHEHLADKIEKEFRAAINPDYVKVTLKVAPRGGVYTTVIKGMLGADVLKDPQGS